MGKVFSVECKSCGVSIGFEDDDIVGLESYIESEVEDRSDSGPDDDDEQPSLASVGGARLFYELAVAVRRGDRAEAELLLDRMAEGWGLAAQELVQQGRYSPAARRAPAEVG